MSVGGHYVWWGYTLVQIFKARSLITFTVGATNHDDNYDDGDDDDDDDDDDLTVAHCPAILPVHGH